MSAAVLSSAGRGRWLLMLGVVLAATAGCPRETAKREARERVFAPPAPDPVVVAAGQKIDVGALARDAAVRDRVNRMPFAEIAARLGHLVFEGEQELVAQRDPVKRRSAQTVRIRQSDTGAFAADVEFPRGEQQHLVFFGEVFYVRHNYGQWRASRDPTDERVHWREEAYRLWPAVYELFGSSLRFAEGVATTHAGRPAVRYEVSVVAQQAKSEYLPEELRTISPDAGEFERARLEARRLEQWRQHALPEGGAGTLIVDEQTGVLLEVSFAGALRIEDDPAQTARMDITLRCGIQDIGVDPKLAPPEDYVEEYSRRKIVTRPLEFLDGGVLRPRAAADGGA